MKLRQGQDPVVQPSLVQSNEGDQSAVYIQKLIRDGVMPLSRDQIKKMMALATMHGVKTVFQTHVYRFN